jgi:hypothetical protein
VFEAVRRPDARTGPIITLNSICHPIYTISPVAFEIVTNDGQILATGERGSRDSACETRGESVLNGDSDDHIPYNFQ